jgi:hypothetical protein
MTPIAQFKGDKKTERKAPEALRWLVTLAESKRKVRYSEFGSFIGVFWRTVPQILGVIGRELERLEREFPGMPPIQLLVVTKTTGVPGDSGLIWAVKDRALLATLSPTAKRALHEGVLQQVFAWGRWREVLAAFGLEPLPLGVLSLGQLAAMVETSRPEGGEGENHRRLREYVAACPSAAKLDIGLPMGSTERLILSGDRVDVFFELPDQWICVEVKGSDSSEGDILRGIFQCVKYRAVLEAQRHYLKGTMLPSVKVALILAGNLPLQLRPIVDLLDLRVTPCVVVPAGFDQSPERAKLLASARPRGVAGC